MNKRIAVKSLFRTADYSNVEFTEEITEIPEKIFLNQKIMELMKTLCVVENEKAFNVYLQLSKLTRSNSIKEIMAFLQEEGTSNQKLIEIEKLLDAFKTKTYEDLVAQLQKE